MAIFIEIVGISFDQQGGGTVITPCALVLTGIVNAAQKVNAPAEFNANVIYSYTDQRGGMQHFQAPADPLSRAVRKVEQGRFTLVDLSRVTLPEAPKPGTDINAAAWITQGAATSSGGGVIVSDPETSNITAR